MMRCACGAFLYGAMEPREVLKFLTDFSGGAATRERDFGLRRVEILSRAQFWRVVLVFGDVRMSRNARGYGDILCPDFSCRV